MRLTRYLPLRCAPPPIQGRYLAYLTTLLRQKVRVSEYYEKSVSQATLGLSH